ncbi:dnaK protein [Purpureocillium lavendulum]|uniref:DnaK protein n=1 Tax=Purpureocillium lavendulum TaxID=1247861 RepID=A0AB34FK80_9HYPO|nr:dnaK protein [Purpureocillium lavendulum]
MAPDTYTIGVDLGTTNVCVYVNGEPCTIENGEIERSRVRVSTTWGLAPPSAIPDPRQPHLTLAKRILGRSKRDGQLATDARSIPLAEIGEHGAQYNVHGQVVQPEEVVAFILGKIKAAVENKFRGQVPGRMVITVPAHFTQQQRQATRDAAEVAGFDTTIIELVEEPVAGAIDFIESRSQNAEMRSADIRRLVVLDIGGGTTDASLLSFEVVNDKKHSYGVLATSGNNQLGGFDFDKVLSDLVLSKAQVEDGKVDAPKLLLECENAKRVLSTADSVSIEIPVLSEHDGLPPVKVTRSEFENASKELLQSVENILTDLIDQRDDAREPNIVLLIGGACSMPCIRDICEQRFPNAEIGNANPERSIARGAGRIASSAIIHVKGVLPRSVGFEVHGIDGKLVTELVIPRNSPLPIECDHQLRTNMPNQETVEFLVMEGEKKRVAENTEVGRFCITGIGPCRKGTPISIVMTIKKPGEIEVTARIKGKEGHLKVDPTPRVDPDRLSEWRKRTFHRLGLGIVDSGIGSSARDGLMTRTSADRQGSAGGADEPVGNPETESYVSAQEASADKGQFDEAVGTSTTPPSALKNVANATTNHSGDSSRPEEPSTETGILSARDTLADKDNTAEDETSVDEPRQSPSHDRSEDRNAVDRTGPADGDPSEANVDNEGRQSSVDQQIRTEHSHGERPPEVKHAGATRKRPGAQKAHPKLKRVKLAGKRVARLSTSANGR